MCRVIGIGRCREERCPIIHPEFRPTPEVIAAARAKLRGGKAIPLTDGERREKVAAHLVYSPKPQEEKPEEKKGKKQKDDDEGLDGLANLGEKDGREK